jgi:hypothetical protein
VRPAALFLSGMAAAFAGAFIRTCQSQVPVELLNAWCGPEATNHFASFSHVHCAGCAVMFAGLALMSASLIRPVRLTLGQVRR